MFVGRDRELAEIVAALPGGDRSAGGLWLVTGEPGIGKTRLAVEVASAARRHGSKVTWGRCWEAGGAPAFWPWREALESVEIAFPDPAALGISDPAEARFALFRQVVSALGREAARQPLVIVLEDLHAADLSTLLLLEFVAGQLWSIPVVVIGTYRDLEARLRPETAEPLARLGRAAHIQLLTRLGRPEVVALVRDAIAGADEILSASVYDTTQGNPLFVAEVIRDVRARGAARSPTEIPLGVREAIRQRLSLVTDDVRRMLEAGSVLGVAFRRQDLERMIVGSAPVQDALDRGVLTDLGGSLRFSHALYREALYHDLPREARERLHREAARALAEASAPVAEIAHHLLEAGPDAAPEAINQAIRAAEAALAMFAFEDALLLLERARLAVPEGELAGALRGRVLVATGEARIRSGDPSGRALCVEAAEIARERGDAGLLAAAGLAYGAVFMMGSVDPSLVGILEEALARLPEQDEPLRARVMARLAAARQPSPIERRQRDIDLALESIAMARRVAGPRDLLGVLHFASGALYGAADPRVRLPNARDQERLALELGDTTRLLQARVRLAMDLLELGDFASYSDLATAYEEVAAPIGRAAAPWRVPLMRSMVALVADRFDESERYQAQARELESERPNARRAQALHRIGFLRAAERHADLRASIGTLRSIWLELPFGGILAEARVASVLAHIGAEEEVRAIMAQQPEEVFREQINHAWLIQAVWLTGDATHAALLREQVGWLQNRWLAYWLDTEITEAPCSRLLAYLEAICGNWREAERLFSSALEAVEAIGRRSMASRMRFEMGDLMIRLDHDRERAAGLLEQARAGAEALGLGELVALIDRRDARRPGAGRGVQGELELVREGEYYSIAGPNGPLRFKANRGMQYLAYLVARPGVEVHVLDLAGATEEVDRGDAGQLVDAAALRAYRARLETLRATAEDAELLGDTDRAEQARDEMEAIAGELSRSTSLGGRSRRTTSAVERARSAVQRRIKDAIDRIADAEPELGGVLRKSVRTGNYCSYRPER